ncbi:MAG TPA: glycoside hydrolase domain-containing protein [Anaerolineaceae bacterium]|nr:glycoside hydrolase domain-containing protein [Anaerolineaceae bacterium]
MKHQTMRKINQITVLLAFAAALGALNFATSDPLRQASAASAPVPIRSFHYFAPGSGWIWIGDQLFRAGAGGWTAITPDPSGGSSLLEVVFLNAQTGWALAAGADGLVLFATRDAGQSWQAYALPVDAALLEFKSTAVHFTDERNGWIVFQAAGSSNFDLGILYSTRDGGQSWERLSIPSGGPVQFPTPSLGWNAGGAGRAGLFQSQSGGGAWEEIRPDAGEASYQLPIFAGPSLGMLVASGEGRADLLLTRDGGQSWGLAQTIPAAALTLADPVHIPASAAGAGHFVVSIPGDSALYHLDAAGALTAVAAQDLPGAVQELDFLSDAEGYAQVFVPCADPKSTGCAPETRLLHTLDSGATWEPAALPALAAPSGAFAAPQAAAVTYPQALDKCDLSSTASLGVWWTSSPYRATNIYLGGANRVSTCLNKNLTAANLRTLNLQGWKFIPTWVGPQASCTTYKSVMSSDPTTALNQGISEAFAAADIAVALGIPPGEPGSTIYFDLEAYNYLCSGAALTTARNAAKSFISGWTTGLHARGYKSGVYGGSCSSYISDFVSITYVPEAVWVAYWNRSGYDPNASIYGIPCLNDGLWNSGNRIHQYAGDHNETWGSVTLAIDSNVYQNPYISNADTKSPVGTIALANGAPKSLSLWVTVNSNASDAASGIASIRLRNLGDANWSAWQAYAPQVMWRLPGPFGQTFTVEAQWMDAAGNVSVVVSDSIFLEKGIDTFFPLISR